MQAESTLGRPLRLAGVHQRKHAPARRDACAHATALVMHRHRRGRGRATLGMQGLVPAQQSPRRCRRHGGDRARSKRTSPPILPFYTPRCARLTGSAARWGRTRAPTAPTRRQGWRGRAAGRACDRRAPTALSEWGPVCVVCVCVCVCVGVRGGGCWRRIGRTSVHARASHTAATVQRTAHGRGRAAGAGRQAR